MTTQHQERAGHTCLACLATRKARYRSVVKLHWRPTMSGESSRRRFMPFSIPSMRRSMIWHWWSCSSSPPATHSRPSGSTKVIISKPIIPPIGAFRNVTFIQSYPRLPSSYYQIRVPHSLLPKQVASGRVWCSSSICLIALSDHRSPPYSLNNTPFWHQYEKNQSPVSNSHDEADDLINNSATLTAYKGMEWNGTTPL